MATCKSIRLDFPARDIPLSDHEILVLLQDALIAAATSNTTRGRLIAAQKLAAAASEARVETYDDRFGGPVFYIP